MKMIFKVSDLDNFYGDGGWKGLVGGLPLKETVALELSKTPFVATSPGITDEVVKKIKNSYLEPELRPGNIQIMELWIEDPKPAKVSGANWGQEVRV